MKSQEGLRRSYQKQKEVFDAATERKISNTVEQIDLVLIKIQKLEAQRDLLLQQKDQLLQRKFPTEEEFFRSAEEKSKQSRDPKVSETTMSIDPQLQKLSAF